MLAFALHSIHYLHSESHIDFSIYYATYGAHYGNRSCVLFCGKEKRISELKISFDLNQNPAMVKRKKKKVKVTLDKVLFRHAVFNERCGRCIVIMCT